jgi:hypothetical protein
MPETATWLVELILHLSGEERIDALLALASDWPAYARQLVHETHLLAWLEDRLPVTFLQLFLARSGLLLPRVAAYMRRRLLLLRRLASADTFVGAGSYGEVRRDSAGLAIKYAAGDDEERAATCVPEVVRAVLSARDVDRTPPVRRVWLDTKEDDFRIDCDWAGTSLFQCIQEGRAPWHNPLTLASQLTQCAVSLQRGGWVHNDVTSANLCWMDGGDKKDAKRGRLALIDWSLASRAGWCERAPAANAMFGPPERNTSCPPPALHRHDVESLVATWLVLASLLHTGNKTDIEKAFRTAYRKWTRATMPTSDDEHAVAHTRLLLRQQAARHAPFGLASWAIAGLSGLAGVQLERMLKLDAMADAKTDKNEPPPWDWTRHVPVGEAERTSPRAWRLAHLAGWTASAASDQILASEARPKIERALAALAHIQSAQHVEPMRTWAEFGVLLWVLQLRPDGRTWSTCC